MLTNENFKYLSYRFNEYVIRSERPFERIRQTVTLEDEFSLLKLQRENWQYSIENILAVSEKDSFEIDGEADLEEETITDILDNVIISKKKIKFYNNSYGFSAWSFLELILSSAEYIIEATVKEMQLN